MPPKDYRERKPFLIADSGIVLPHMDEIPELHIDSELIDEETQKMLDALREPVELSFSFNMPISPGDLILIMCGGCTWKQIQQNNWRRLHGLPMRRKNVSSRISRTE